MCKSLIVCLALVFGLVSTSSADILIGNFENSNSDSWGPGWEGTPKLSSTTDGVTLQDMALCVSGINWGYWTFSWNSPVGPFSLADVYAVQMDVTMRASEWTSAWTKVDKLAVKSDGASGWTEYQSSSSTGDTSWGSWSGDVQKVITWDMSENTYNTTGATYLQINIALQGPSDPKGGNFHIDNIRLLSDYDQGNLTGLGVVMGPCVPEPMTIAMLGLGSLALLRKKQ
jgi:hypothetical protein